MGNVLRVWNGRSGGWWGAPSSPVVAVRVDQRGPGVGGVASGQVLPAWMSRVPSLSCFLTPVPWEEPCDSAQRSPGLPGIPAHSPASVAALTRTSRSEGRPPPWDARPIPWGVGLSWTGQRCTCCHQTHFPPPPPSLR